MSREPTRDTLPIATRMQLVRDQLQIEAVALAKKVQVIDALNSAAKAGVFGLEEARALKRLEAGRRVDLAKLLS